MTEGSSFYLPMRFLPSPRRQAMHTLYDFCRQADDAVDEAASAEDARKRLMKLRAAIFNMYGNPHLLSSDPLQCIIGRYRLRRDYFDAILDGMEMDASGQMLRPDLETLTLYCYRVAGCVGLLSVAILGESGKAAEKFAVTLGHALQLTNILRDVEEDARRGRLYLPVEWLTEEGIETIEPHALYQHRESVERVCGKLADLAERYFRDAEALSHLCNRRRLLSALLMRDIYQNILHRMCAQGHFLAARKVRFGFLRKLGMVAGAARYLF